MSSDAAFRPDLVRWIVRYAWDCGYKLTTIRIVKFLYLCDILSFRFHKKVVTNWSWAFYHFGPFCQESLDSIKSAVKQDFIRSEKKISAFNENDFTLFSSEHFDEEIIPTDVSIAIRGKLENAIKQMGNDTYQLLDFVYFHTEPMLFSKPGAVLDFSTVVSWESLREIKLKKMDKALIQKAREVISKIPESPKFVKPLISFELMGEDFKPFSENINLRFVDEGNGIT
jgi:hypothetical protein